MSQKTGRYAALSSIHKNLYISDIQHVDAHWKEYDCIVSICQHCEIPYDLRDAGFDGWYCFPMDDAHVHGRSVEHKTKKIMRKASRAVRRGLNNGRVLLHCAAGQNRSAAVAAMVAMKLHECSPDEAIDRIVRDKAATKLPHWPTLTNQSFRSLLRTANES